MTNEVMAVLKTTRGAPVPLKGVTATGRLEGLLFELTVEQVYENAGTRNIEAEFTFPVPHRAVLLGLELKIGERALEAVAVRRQAAREKYEAAIDDGNSAALVEQAGDGLWHLSLGNLLAGERAVIRYRYAELLDRQGDEVRLTVPTVIAPRFGDAGRAGLPAHIVPRTDLLAEYPFGLTLDIRGDMARAGVDSPSHRIESRLLDGSLQVQLAAGAFLDRDFVLRLSGAVTRAAAIVAPDPGRMGEPGYTALLSLDPGATAGEVTTPLALKLLVDCSGSMAGASLNCAKRALLAALDRLKPADQVSLTRFGSTVEHATAGLLPVGGGDGLLARIQRTVVGTNVPALRHAIRHLEADLGGTELADGLRATLAIPAGDVAARNILLITDAEVWDVDGVLDAVATAGHRLFVVAVGSAPVESLSRRLASATGGACEFVAPGEAAEAAILRMYARLREQPKQVSEVVWPIAPEWALPLPRAVFAGDTLHLIAGFAAPPAGEVAVTIADAEGTRTLTASFGEPTGNAVLPRLAAALRLPQLPEEEAAELAVRHQLASAHTSLVVVQARAEGEKPAELPALAAVPHMLAAGWGGTALLQPADIVPTFSKGGESIREFEELGIPSFYLEREAPPLDSFVPPTDPLRQRSPAQELPPGPRGPAAVLAALVDLRRRRPTHSPLLADLADVGVPAAAIAALAGVIRQRGLDEAGAVRAWIALLAASPAGRGLNPADRRLLEAGVAGDRHLREARAVVRDLLEGVDEAAWSGAGAETRLEV